MKVLVGLVSSEAPLSLVGGWAPSCPVFMWSFLCVPTLVSLFYFMYLFLAVLGLRCCVGYSLAAAGRGTL